MPPARDDRAFIDCHCHSCASFDSTSRPAGIVAAAMRRGLTHLAITDHDRIDGALRARDLAPADLTVIVGQEIRTRDGDLLGLFLERPVPAGLPLADALAAVHAQGGLTGLPHPFDRWRNSAAAGERLARLAEVAPQIDFVEAYNARVAFGAANERAADFAREHGLPGVASSDAHTQLEVGVACTIVTGPLGTPGELHSALAGAVLMTGHASYLVRGWTPIAKIINRMRGNHRVRPSASSR